MQNRGDRRWSIWLILAVLAASTWAGLLHVPGKASTLVPLTEAARLIRTGQVKEMVIDTAAVQVEKIDGEQLAAHKEPNVSLIATLRRLGVTPTQLRQVNLAVRRPSLYGAGVLHWLVVLSPLVLVVLLFCSLARPTDIEPGQFGALLGSPAHRYQRALNTRIDFDDVAGEDEAKAELEEVVEFLRSPQKFARLGAHVPHGTLLVGPPGCGKTLLARAVAGEAGVPFFSVNASEFVEIFAGVGASRVRSLFDTARKVAPCIVFVDELDAVGRQRAAGPGLANQEWEQTLNQLLVEMDGFDNDTHIIVLAATNRPDILDAALLRPGRFDRRVMVDLPDRAGREAILAIHAEGKPLSHDVDLAVIARETPGFSGAELENLVNEAAILAARRNRSTIGMVEFQDAAEKVKFGPERRSRTMGEPERQVIAYHEAGHALVMSRLPGCDPVHRVSIVPRGPGLGYTLGVPRTDGRLKRRSELEDELAGLLGGYTAEEVVLGDVTSGAADDLQRANELARHMVIRFGMSEVLGPRTFGPPGEPAFESWAGGLGRDYSQATAAQIDDEVRRLLERAHARARQILSSHRPTLTRLALRLLEAETLDRIELARWLKRNT